ncbi:MAG: ABC transporter permease [Chloroflexota bacterium]|nr:ABC transporter permease [Chloroflexota bacterium]
MAKLDEATTPAPPLLPATRRSLVPERWRRLSQNYGALTVCILLFLLNALFTPHFISFQTLGLNLEQMATTAIVAVGMTLVIGTGGIDLSVGSVMAIAGTLAPIIFLRMSNPILGNTLAIVVPILIGGLCGLFNGWLVTGFRIQPIIATLILFIAGRGIAQVMTNGAGQAFENPGFQFLGQGNILGLPFPAYLMIIIVVFFALVVRHTAFGRYILATGGNESAARLAGVPVVRTKLAVYVITGLLAGLAGLIIVALNAEADASSIGLNFELNAIAAVAIGGTPLIGGQARVVGTLIGALITQLIYTALVGNNVPDAVALIVNAAIILGSVYLQRQRKS